MGWLKFKDIMMPDFVMLEQVPSPVHFEQTFSFVDMPENIPIAYKTKQFKTATIPVTLGFRPRVPDAGFFNRYLHTDYADKDARFSSMTVDEMLDLQFNSVYAWLCEEGPLTFSNDADKYYYAVCNSAITPERISKRLRKLPVQFTVLPFRRAIDNDVVEIPLEVDGNRKKAWISYAGTYPSSPALKLYLTGNLDLQWGGMSIKVDNVVESVTIDAENRRVLDKDGEVILNRTRGAITEITLEDRRFMSVSSNVTKVEIVKNTRWR